MAVPFVSRKRLNPRNLEAEGKFYPAPAYISEIGVNQIAEEISQSTTLTPTEVIGVIKELFAHSSKVHDARLQSAAGQFWNLQARSKNRSGLQRSPKGNRSYSK